MQNKQKHNRPKWWKLADSNPKLSEFRHTEASSIFLQKHFALVQQKYTNYMTDDTPQDTTTTQATPATDQPVVQPEPPKVEEQTQETPSTETSTEEPKVEPAPEVPETPQTPEPPKEEATQEEQKPVEETKLIEETKSEEKLKEEVKPEPEKPQPPQTNLDELRAKANKERQDRKAEHLLEVEKLAKSKQINNDDVRELLHVSQSTATNYLEELTKQGKLTRSGKAKGTTYSS